MKLLRNKKGFTLVEIIVVLVIIAILAAISLPALTGYINDAREKSAISEGRTVMVAVQTIASELTGLGKGTDDMKTIEDYIIANAGTGITGYNKTITGLTGIKAHDATKTSTLGEFTALALAKDGAIESFTYKLNGGSIVKFTTEAGLFISKTA